MNDVPENADVVMRDESSPVPEVEIIAQNGLTSYSDSPTPPKSINDDSNDSDEDEDEESDDEPVAPLATTREKRANAGNRLAKLLSSAKEETQAALDIAAAVAAEGDADEAELERAVFEEVEGDEDFASGDEDIKEGSDDDMSSSSSDEESDGEEDGQKRDEEAEDDAVGQSLGLAGTKRKRKGGMRESLLQKTMRLKRIKYNLPGPSPLASTVDATTGEQQVGDGTTMPPPIVRPKKKAEKLAAAPADGAVRASARSATKVNSLLTAENSKVSAQRRRELLAKMAKAEESKKIANPPKVLTQEERLEQAAEIEKQNSKSLNRWEESERRRVEDQRARLEALKNRKLHGPVITYWTGPSVWFNDKLKRVGKSRLVEEIEAERDGRPLRKIESDEEEEEAQVISLVEEMEPKLESSVIEIQNATEVEEVEEKPTQDENQMQETQEIQETPAMNGEVPSLQEALDTNEEKVVIQEKMELIEPEVDSTADREPEVSVQTNPETLENSDTTLEPAGMEESKPSDMEVDTSIPPQQPVAETPSLDSTSQDITNPQTEILSIDPATLSLDQSTSELLVTDAEPPQPPEPIIRSLASRSLVILSSFSNLSASRRDREREREASPEGDTATTTRHYRHFDRENAILLRTLFAVPPAVNDEKFIEPVSHTRAPESLHAYNKPETAPPEFRAYDPANVSGQRISYRYLSKRDPRCPITGTVVRYRDPATGIAYGNAAAFKSLRRLRKGYFHGKGGVWSEFLQAWVGDPRPAKGVPEEVWFGKKSNDSDGVVNGDGASVKKEGEETTAILIE